MRLHHKICGPVFFVMVKFVLVKCELTRTTVETVVRTFCKVTIEYFFSSYNTSIIADLFVEVFL